MGKYDLILVKAWCWQHGKRTWHILMVDGNLMCLECRLEGQEVPAIFRVQGVAAR